MNDLGKMTSQQLRGVLDEAQEQITEIRAELDRRERQKQHQAIDDLELPAARTGVDWSEVKAFFQQVLEDLRGKEK